MTNRYLEHDLLNQVNEVYRLKNLEYDLVEQFDFAFNWVLRASKKLQAELPNKEGIESCLERIEGIMDEIYGKTPDSEHPGETPGKRTEPFFLLFASA